MEQGSGLFEKSKDVGHSRKGFGLKAIRLLGKRKGHEKVQSGRFNASTVLTFLTLPISLRCSDEGDTAFLSVEEFLR